MLVRRTPRTRSKCAAISSPYQNQTPKRLEHIPDSHPSRVRIISDNPLYKPYEGSGEEVHIIGRIRWFAREM
jgi:hypothetical protein